MPLPLLVLLLLAADALGAQPRRPRVTPGVPWWADSANWDARVVRRRDVDRPARVMDAGDTLALAVPELPAALPDSLRARRVPWSSDDPAVAAVDDGGRVVAVAAGRTIVTAWTVVGAVRTPVVVRAVARGVVVGEDGGPLGGVRVRVSGGTWADSARTGADGAFQVRLPADAGAVDVAFVPPAALARHPATLRAVAPGRAHRLAMVLLPLTWRIAAGRWAGVVLPVRPAEALAPAGDGTRFWRLVDDLTAAAAAPRGLARGVAQGTPVGWADDAPIPTALAAARGTPLDTATADAVWEALHALGEAWGRPLVRAVAPESAAVLVHLAPGLREAGNTDAAWDARGTIAAATVALRDRAVARDARVVQHELLHALGLGHVAAWPSVLAAPGARTAGAATPDDVAHGQLIAAVRALARPGRAGRAALPGPPLLAPP